MFYLKNIIILLLFFSSIKSQKTYIHAGRLIDGITEIPIEMVTIVINDNTGEQVKSGFLEVVMLENSILSVNVDEVPKGLPSSGVVLRTINNTNGINITNVTSNAGSSYTCRIPTPPLGFPVNPFKANDRVFVESIVGVGTTGTVNPNTESGFNSSDYGFKLLKVSKSKYLRDSDMSLPASIL